MWIALRIILACIGFCVRQWRRRSTPAVHGTHDGVPYYLVLWRRKHKVTGFRIGMPRRSPTWLRMHGESALDRLFKRLGMANESQTGDAGFDDKVYVTCDHPFVSTLLRHAPALRAAVVDALDAGYTRVWFDGSTVWLEREASAAPDDRALGKLAAVHAASAKLEGELPSALADPFLWKAFVVEGVIWGILGYALGAFLELGLQREDYHLNPRDVMITGAVVAVFSFVALLGLVALWMRGSSRGHRIIVESAFVLLVGLPPACIQVVGDSNRAMDSAPPQIVTATVDQCERRLHRGRKGSRWYSYHLWLERTDGVPLQIAVTRRICDAASPGDDAEIAIGPGRWGLRWYRSISVGGATWTAP